MQNYQLGIDMKSTSEAHDLYELYKRNSIVITIFHLIAGLTAIFVVCFVLVYGS